MRWILLLLIICSCSATKHLQLAKYHQMKAESKGAKIERDTILKTIKIPVFVKGDSGKSDFHPEVDEIGFFEALNANDSLVMVISGKYKSIATGAIIDKEKALHELNKARAEKKALEQRMSQGFSKDSVYVLEDDRVKISTEIKDGLLRNQDYIVKDKTIIVDETVPVEIRNIFKAGYTLYEIIAMGVGFGVICIIIGFAIGINTKK